MEEQNVNFAYQVPFNLQIKLRRCIFFSWLQSGSVSDLLWAAAWEDSMEERSERRDDENGSRSSSPRSKPFSKTAAVRAPLFYECFRCRFRRRTWKFSVRLMDGALTADESLKRVSLQFDSCKNSPERNRTFSIKTLSYIRQRCSQPELCTKIQRNPGKE